MFVAPSGLQKSNMPFKVQLVTAVQASQYNIPDPASSEP